MTTDEVQGLRESIADLVLTMRTGFTEVRGDIKALSKADDAGEKKADDLEKRVRKLETANNERAGVVKLLTAGGVVGAVLAAPITALVFYLIGA